MKTLTSVLIIALLLVSGSALAQDLDYDKTFRFGLKGGLAISDVNGEDANDFINTTYGFSAGGFVAVRLGEGIWLQPEIYYVQKGFTVESTADTLLLDADADVNMDYIEVPLLLRYDIPMNGPTPYAIIGPAVSFVLTSKIDIEAAAPGSTIEGEIDTEIENSVDLGLVLGGGVDFPVGSGNRLILDIRYVVGLVDMFDDAAPGELPGDLENLFQVTEDGLDLKNGVFMFQLGFAF